MLPDDVAMLERFPRTSYSGSTRSASQRPQAPPLPGDPAHRRGNNRFYSTEDALHKSLLVACGVVEPVITLTGEIIFVPSSTAFEAMPEEEFKIYFDKAMELISTTVIPDLDLDELMKEARSQSNYKEAA